MNQPFSSLSCSICFAGSMLAASIATLSREGWPMIVLGIVSSIVFGTVQVDLLVVCDKSISSRQTNDEADGKRSTLLAQPAK